MLSGTHKVELATPLGVKSGRVVIEERDGAALLKLDAPLIGKRQVTGTCSGNSFSAQGVVKSRLIGTHEYSVEGVVEGDELSCVLITGGNSYQVTGTRV